MNRDESTTTDLIRWTFTVPEAAAGAVEEYLTDFGADVFVRNGHAFHVTWDEPELDLDPVVEEVWRLAGQPFEITQEEFHRLELHILHHEADEHKTTTDAEFHPGFDSLETMDL